VKLAPENQKLLIHVSNFRPVKRTKEVVQVFARIRQEVPARLLMVGDGPDLVDCVALARSLGVSDDVQFLGEQDQVVPLLSAAQVFLLPSSQESFGLAALEAMACEVPVVASRIGGLPELVEDGVSGFLHDPDDLEAMARSAIELLTDEALHHRVAQGARQRARDRFCDSKIVPLYEAYYEEILTRA
jgi:N-acetyl-alpha-D-glucosaminyl L-malate synthase BshA